MKKINLITIAVLIFLLISCAGSAKKKGGDAKKANEPAKTTEAAKKPEDASADKKNAAENTAADAKKETPNTETAQADADKEKSADEKSSLETDPSAKEVAAVTPPTPPVQPPAAQQPAQPQPPPRQPPQTPQQPPAQTQPPRTQPQTPPAQTQPQTPAAQTQQQTPPAQPPADDKKAASNSAADNSDQTKKELPPPTEGPSPPAPRIDSLVQMGTMPNDNQIAFSRVVYAIVGQTVEIPFRGTGWIFFGEIASQRGIVFNGRRNDADGQTIIFSLEEPGTYVLKFYKRDFIRDFILNDYVQVIAEDAPKTAAGWLPADRGKVVAQPRWPSVIEETQIITGTKPPTEPVVTKGTAEPPAKTTTPPPAASAPASQSRPTTETTAPQRTTPAPQTNTTSASSSNITPPAPPSSASSAAQIPSMPAIAPSETPSAEKKEVLTPETAAQKAKENYDGGKIPEAIALLNQFMLDYPDGSDEIYWLLGQYYEANSPSRNILLSLDYYRRLINEYPQSRRFDDAKRRIAYLERYYINIQ